MIDRTDLLLDTQAVIAWAQGKTPVKLTSLIISGAKIHVSIVSLWEFIPKAPRFEVIGLGLRDFQPIIKSLKAHVVPIELDHLRTLERLPFAGTHRDPFDRLIISQAVSEHFILAGKDRAFPQFSSTELGKSRKIFWE